MKDKWIRVLLGVALAGFAVVGGAGVSTGDDLLVAIVIGLPVLVLAFLNPKITIFLVFFFSIIYHDFIRQLLPNLDASRRIMDILIIALFIRALLSKAAEGRFNFTPAFIPGLAWLILVSFSASMNHIPLLNFLLKLRHMGLFILFFYSLANLNLEPQTVKRGFWFFFALACAQALVALWNYRVYGMSDLVRGFTPGGPELTFILLWATGFIYGLYLYTKRINLLSLILICGVFLVIPVMSGIRAVFYFYPVLAFILLISPIILSAVSKENPLPVIRKGFSGALVTVISLAAGVAFVPMLNNLYHILYRTFIWGIYNQERVYAVAHVGRFVAPKIAHSYLVVKGLPGLIMGYGLGSVVLSKFVSFAARKGSFAALTTQLPVSLYETGYLGVILYAAMAICAACLIIPCFKMAKDGDERAMVFSLVVPAVAFIGMTVYYWVWIEHIAGTTFWGLAGLVAALYYYRKEEARET
ncbi:MAG: hypothetical protein ABIM74_02530 [candidate division WOR-3 bacterium]